MRLLNELGLLVGTKLDYGCGKGTDADTFKMDKYDKYFEPKKIKKKYSTITCNYVLNVITEKEGIEVMKDIQSHLRVNGTAYITVRRDIKKEGLTSKNTYQRNVILDLPILTEKKGNYCIYLLDKNTKL